MLLSIAQGRVSALRARIRKLIVNPDERLSFCRQLDPSISHWEQ